MHEAENSVRADLPVMTPVMAREVRAHVSFAVPRSCETTIGVDNAFDERSAVASRTLLATLESKSGEKVCV
jgi:hypothetical protein